MATATYDPHTDILTYTLGAGTHDPDFARAAQLGAAGFSVHQTPHGTHYTAPWSPEGEGLLRTLAGTIGDAHAALADGLTWDPNAGRWEDPAYWQARALRAVAKGCAVPVEDSTARHQQLGEDAASMEAVATEALATQRRWESILPAKGQEGSERFRLCVSALLKDTPQRDRLLAQLEDGRPPLEIASELINGAAQLYRWAKRSGCHVRARLAYFHTMQHPGEVREALSPAQMIALAAPTENELVCLIGFPDSVQVPACSSVVRAQGAQPLPPGSAGECDVVCLYGEREPTPILQALQLVTDGGRLVAVCSQAALTAMTRAAITLRSMLEFLEVTTTPLSGGRLLLQVRN